MKCGTVAVVGRANAGKSTLVNVLVGEKVSIVSPKPQTTRDRIYGVLTTDDYQIVFEDTPGIYKASGLLSSKMQKTTETTARDTDLILFVIDGHDGLKEDDKKLLGKYVGRGTPVIAALSKIDIMPKDKIPEELCELAENGEISEIIPVSARKGRNVKELLNLILKYLPESEYVFDPNAISDKSEKFMISEIMREKILLKYDKEIPHGTAVEVTKFSERDNGIIDLEVTIYCEKDSHKGIIIGKKGAMLKKIGELARTDIEEFMGTKVYLQTWVKVKENWRDSMAQLRNFGFSEQ